MTANTAKTRAALVDVCQQRAKPIRDALRECDGALLARSADPSEGFVFERWIVSARDYPTRATLLVLVMSAEGWDLYGPLTRTNSTADTIAAVRALVGAAG
jgi:hypothetical protein